MTRGYKCALGLDGWPPIIEALKACDGTHEIIVEHEWIAEYGMLPYEMEWCKHLHRTPDTAQHCPDAKK